MIRYRDKKRAEKYFGIGDSPTLGTFLLKKRGHEIIDQIEMLGTPRLMIYHKLGKRMGSHALAHFAQVTDLPTLNRMVKHLEDMLARKRQKMQLSPIEIFRGPAESKYDYKIMFTDKDLLRKVGDRNRAKCVPAWRRWLLRLRGILRL